MNWPAFGRYGGIASAALSLAAFCISIYTFWYNYVQPAEVSVSVARTVSIGRNSVTGFRVFTTPLTFVNNGGRNAVIDLVTITVDDPGDARSRVWEAEDEVQKYELSGPFAPIDVPARKSVTQVFRFKPKDRLDDPIFAVPGDYRIRVSIHMVGDSHSVSLDKYTRIAADDLPYIQETIQRWPLIVDLVSEATDLGTTETMLRRW